jgi:hypothetical protein
MFRNFADFFGFHHGHKKPSRTPTFRSPRAAYRPHLEWLEDRSVPATALSSTANSLGVQLVTVQTLMTSVQATEAAFDANYKVFSRRLSVAVESNLVSAFLNAQQRALLANAAVPAVNSFTLSILQQQAGYIGQEVRAFDTWYVNATRQHTSSAVMLVQLDMLARSFQTTEQTATAAIVQEVATGVLMPSTASAFIYTTPILGSSAVSRVPLTHPTSVLSSLNNDEIRQLQTIATSGIQPRTNITLTSSANPSVPSGSISFIAQVSAVNPGAGTPTGSVSFFVGNVLQATINLNSQGQAVFTASQGSIGNQTVTASSGGSQLFPAVSTTLT